MTGALELSIDTCSDMASIALSREGAVETEQTWDIGRDHSRQLMPAIDGLLVRLSASRGDITAVFVSIGPGSYAGVRAGVSTAKGLAYGLEVPLVGVGRLEVEAWGWRNAGGGLTIVAVHRAGRRDYAWAAYAADPWREVAPPTLVALVNLVAAVPEEAFVAGELEQDDITELVARGHAVSHDAATQSRAALLAELGWARLRAGRTDDPKSLVPIYLREPAIGPQDSKG